MAFLIKNQHRSNGSGIQPVILQQWIQVTQQSNLGTGILLPQAAQSSTGQLFRVRGGRVLMHILIGEVTTIIQSQATTVKVSSKKLNTASTAVGTAVDLCATVDGNAKEVGSLFVPLGSGAAAIWNNAGASLGTLGRNPTILPQGEVYITTGADSSGAMKWDMWYQPLDAGAFVEAAVLSSGILTTAI